MQHIDDEKTCHFTNPTLGLMKSAIQGTLIVWLRKKHKGRSKGGQRSTK